MQDEALELARQLFESASSTYSKDEEADVIVAKCRALIESGADVNAPEPPPAAAGGGDGGGSGGRKGAG